MHFGYLLQQSLLPSPHQCCQPVAERHTEMNELMSSVCSYVTGLIGQVL